MAHQLLLVVAILLITGISSSSSLDDVAGHHRLVLTVDQSGKGDYKTIQEAINAVPAPAASAGKVLIRIRPGIYSESVLVNKPNISLIGSGFASTIITWRGKWDNIKSSTVSVQASDFVAKDLAFQNTLGPGAPAIAAIVSGDRVAFFGCRFVSYQDTLLDDKGRHYYSDCYVEGATDFIFGSGRALFENCRLNSTSMGGGSFTAQRRNTDSEKTGFSFVSSKLSGVRAGASVLGRPWGPYSRVVFSLCNISNIVEPVGVREDGFAEFNCYGEGSWNAGRARWSHKLSSAEAAPFLTKAWIDGQYWLSDTIISGYLEG